MASVSTAVLMSNKPAITLWFENVQWFPYCLPVTITYKFLHNLPFYLRSLPCTNPGLPTPCHNLSPATLHCSADPKVPQFCPLACLCKCCSFCLEYLFPYCCQAISYLCFHTQFKCHLFHEALLFFLFFSPLRSPKHVDEPLLP